MPKWYESVKFRKLQAEWYAKLKEEGFEDIEILTGDGTPSPLLRGYSRMDAIRFWRPQTQRYYELARQHAEDMLLPGYDWCPEVSECPECGSVAGTKGCKRCRGMPGPHKATRARTAEELYGVWSLHAEGKSSRYISRTLGVGRDRVMEIIRSEARRSIAKGEADE